MQHAAHSTDLECSCLPVCKFAFDSSLMWSHSNDTDSLTRCRHSQRSREHFHIVRPCQSSAVTISAPRETSTTAYRGAISNLRHRGSGACWSAWRACVTSRDLVSYLRFRKSTVDPLSFAHLCIIPGAPAASIPLTLIPVTISQDHDEHTFGLLYLGSSHWTSNLGHIDYRLRANGEIGSRGPPQPQVKNSCLTSVD